MTLPGQPNDQPSKYRLGLTLSLAFLLHTLILAGLTHLLPQQPDEQPATVRFSLLQPGTTVSTRSEESASNQAAAPTRQMEPQRPASSQPEVISRQGSKSSARTPPKPDASPAPTETKPASQSPTRSSASTPSLNAIASEASTAGAAVETPPPVNESDRPQLPDQDAEQDPYITLLWQHISAELDNRPVRSIHDLKRVRTVRLELHLMDNGTLRQVDTIESSGKPDLDRAARQSALAASPYPEPPESAREKGFRFQVELRFSPRKP